MPDKLKKLEEFRPGELQTIIDKIFFYELEQLELTRTPRCESSIKIPKILIADGDWKELERQIKILATYHFKNKRRAPITTLRKCRGHYVYSVSGME